MLDLPYESLISTTFKLIPLRAANGKLIEMAEQSLETFADANNILSTGDSYFQFDAEEHQRIIQNQPWKEDPHYFKSTKISALALLKMVMHAQSGGNIEIMGLMVGKIDGHSIIVMDSFALPVEGTETRVNANLAAYEYMVNFQSNAKLVGREENVVGWYHSHPGYGCWLSGIDVTTQMNNQQYQDPFIAIVVDPIRTITSGKVDLGAFRTYPENFEFSEGGPSRYQSIPLHKIEDFGVHCKQYYSLDVSYFRSSYDDKLLNTLWKQYRINTLSSNSQSTNQSYVSNQIQDLSCKLSKLQEHQTHREECSKIAKDGTKTAIEALGGIMSGMFKDKVFNVKS